MSKLNVHVEGWDAVAARVTEAWHQAERGETADGGHHLSFTAWERLAAVLTAKRLELLRHLHRNSAVSIAAPWFVSWDGITVRSMTMWRF